MKQSKIKAKKKIVTKIPFQIMLFRIMVIPNYCHFKLLSLWIIVISKYLKYLPFTQSPIPKGRRNCSSEATIFAIYLIRNFQNHFGQLWWAKKSRRCNMSVNSWWHKIDEREMSFIQARKYMWECPNVSTTPITAMGCWQCLPPSVVQLKHCWKPHCRNGIVDTFGHSHNHLGQLWCVLFVNC